MFLVTQIDCLKTYYLKDDVLKNDTRYSRLRNLVLKKKKRCISSTCLWEFKLRFFPNPRLGFQDQNQKEC